jgi:ferrochelatase
MERLGFSHPYLLAYQSEVGPLRWLGPSTARVIRNLGARGQKHVLVIPVAFTSDHIETLYELDREYGDLAREVGMTWYRRAPALNERPAFLNALAAIVQEHLASGALHSSQYPLRCAGCANPECRTVLNPVGAAAPSAR